MAGSGSSAAVIVVVVVIVLLLLLAFFWCGCGGGASSCHTPKLSKSFVPFTAGGLGDLGAPLPLLNYFALGDGNSALDGLVSTMNTAGSRADQFAAAFTRDGQVRKFTVHARLSSATASNVTVGLYISPKSAATQPLFALVQSATFAVTSATAAYFYAQLSTVSNVKAGDRYVVLVTTDVAATVFVVGGGFEYAQCC